MITAAARERFDRAIKMAVDAGAHVLTGGTRLAGAGYYYAPTVLEAATSEPEEALAGAFGPVILVRGVGDVEEAVAAANGSRYALGASVWGRRRLVAKGVARRLQAGMVSVNEAVTPSAHAAAPFGGCKASGYGRTHGTMGVREFTCSHVLFERRPGGFRPQLFPYSRASTVERFLSFYSRMFHPRA
jgi:acyl-CoA reductase-like NAD-dependent aldehyde dehydrogenase